MYVDVRICYETVYTLYLPQSIGLNNVVLQNKLTTYPIMVHIRNGFTEVFVSPYIPACGTQVYTTVSVPPQDPVFLSKPALYA